MLEPGSGAESFGQEFARMALLLEVSHEKFRDCRIIVDDQEFGGGAGENFHGSIISIIAIKHQPCHAPELNFRRWKMASLELASNVAAMAGLTSQKKELRACLGASAVIERTRA